MKRDEPSAESLGLRPLRTVAYRFSYLFAMYSPSSFDRDQFSPERVLDLCENCSEQLVDPWSRVA